MALDPNYNSSEGPVTTDEEEEERRHINDMKQMEKNMRLLKLHRERNKKRRNRKKNKDAIPSLKKTTKKLLIETFHIQELSPIIKFNKDKTFTFKDETFKIILLNPYISLTWKDDAYVLILQINRAMSPIMRWRKNYLSTYHTYRQKDSQFYYKDLAQDLLDHVNIMKYDYVKHFLAMILNTIRTPIGPVVYFKYDKTIKDKEIDEIVNELKDIMIMKIKMRRNGMVLSP
eukprot:356476_1